MPDRVIGKMSVYLMLSKEVRPLCSVDVSNVRTEEDWE